MIRFAIEVINLYLLCLKIIEFHRKYRANLEINTVICKLINMNI